MGPLTACSLRDATQIDSDDPALIGRAEYPGVPRQGDRLRYKGTWYDVIEVDWEPRVDPTLFVREAH
jgi:hypothetical protein